MLVLLDLSAAFDTVDHTILLSRMRDLLGIQGTALSWFRSYLSGRTQQVKIHSNRSSAKVLQYGVPQGSVLGPLLFLVYILPLGQLLKSTSVHRHGYADDKQVYRALSVLRRAQDIGSQLSELERMLTMIHQWLFENKLKGNPEKTEVAVFGTKQSLQSLTVNSISVAGVEVRFSMVPIRNLGVMFDSALSMDSNIKTVIRSASYHLRCIGMARKQLTTDAAKTLVQSLVISRLDYCNSSLAQISEQSLGKLQLLQNRAARIITCTKSRDHITPVLRMLHWLPVRERIEFKVLLIVYKALNGLAPQYISDLITPYTPARSLRSESAYELVEPRFRLITFGGRAFVTLAPRMWNALPIQLRTANTISTFKNMLKTFLFTRRFGV